MSTVSAAVGERSRKFHSLVLQRLASVGQVSVSEQIGVSESTVSRFVVNDIERACQLLAAVGLKVVPVEMQCYPREEIEAIFTLAKSSMNKLDTVEQLQFD